MASDLLSIARSGAHAARIALDITGQNIANAANEGYVRRTVNLKEVAAAGGFQRVGDISVSGVRVAGIIRQADPFRQAEVRRTGSDAARAVTEVDGLKNIEQAVEKTGVYDGIVKFESALERLASNPVDPSLRTTVIAQARNLTSAFNTASRELDGVGEELQIAVDDGVAQVNTLTTELARTNHLLLRAAESPNDKSALLDQRDRLLEKLSSLTNIATKFTSTGAVEVRLGSSGPLLVQGDTASSMTMTTAADGSPQFAVAGIAATVSGGSLAGQGLAIAKLADTRTRLDAVANNLANAVNTAQTNGAALDGSAGQPLFTGSGAGGLTLALTDGAQLATAPAGAPAGSRDRTNLDAMRAALATANPAGGMNAVLVDISSAVAGRTVTRDALSTIAETARLSLERQAGVDLDQEAVNLIRYQQIFQASGRAMQVATDILDSILAIR